MKAGDVHNDKIEISLYEFYAMGINTLLTKSPWEHEERISEYKDSFLYEQQLISLALLYLFGEEYVPKSVLRTMPKEYEQQIRDSVNQAVFSKALKHHHRNLPSGDGITAHMMKQMDSYLQLIREAAEQKGDAIEGITKLLTKRVPARTEEQLDKYYDRVKQIFIFTKKLVEQSLNKKYVIVS